ncbi:hypothetical protein KQY10_12340 [Leptospira interrogans]|uniref:Uncharacterized protein n=1 Tax=Leptospira interrogans serovar Hardjo str. Norma TaxID=1279460 RepID=A0A0M4NX33_LEPIR|nr:hypothetical protein [Leptospira interrogans]ALE38667.1 hypothetical protein G436_1471 [Leptospira interrogans serovar Hardjo str. Norma]ALN99932.1 hypothetical protein LIH_06140 [Leptospira interrogans serovar Hardjo-prajitno]EKO95654.1 hypothetical protein LEP1GSC057_0940 [Leptospira interrogans str. Brem 329]MCD1166375.1 hypothetical protein [Leptospira interrogans]MCH1885824.1 hypothetical protein [Leptospira interrogans]
MIQREIDDNKTREEKIGFLEQYLEYHPVFEIADLYKWLYYGEFGEVEKQEFYSDRTEVVPELQSILDDLKLEEGKPYPDRIWEPLGFSQRYLLVYLRPYTQRDYPLKRLVNLIQRSSAFQGYRMRFKLDWIILKDLITERMPVFNKQEFNDFEDRIGFQQLPDVELSSSYKNAYPASFRVVSAKLFYEYFPEFVKEPKGFSLLTDSKESDESDSKQKQTFVTESEEPIIQKKHAREGRHSRFDRMEIGEEEMGEVVIPENFNFDGL